MLTTPVPPPPSLGQSRDTRNMVIHVIELFQNQILKSHGSREGRDGSDGVLVGKPEELRQSPQNIAGHGAVPFASSTGKAS